MRAAAGVLVFALWGSLLSAAQIPLPCCGCSFGSSSAACSCLEGVSKETGKPMNEPMVCDGGREILGDWITLAPGADLTRAVPSEDDLIVGEAEGTLANEAKSPSPAIDVSAGTVLFMPKDEPYKLRNVGKQSLRIILVRMLATPPARH